MTPPPHPLPYPNTHQPENLNELHRIPPSASISYRLDRLHTAGGSNRHYGAAVSKFRVVPVGKGYPGLTGLTLPSGKEIVVMAVGEDAERTLVERAFVAGDAA